VTNILKYEYLIRRATVAAVMHDVAYRVAQK